MRRLSLACILAASLTAGGCADMDPTVREYTATGLTAGAVTGAGVSLGLGDPFLGTALLGGLVGGAVGFVYGTFWAEDEEMAGERHPDEQAIY